MNKKKLSEFLSHKTWLWLRVFRNLYIAKHGLYEVLAKTDLQPSTILRLCRNEDDFGELWDLAEMLDYCEDDIIGTIEDLRFCKPVPWQYDFLQTMIELSEMPIENTLDLNSIADAYCAALMLKDFDVSALMSRLDTAYGKLYRSAAHKEYLVHRNLSLVLEEKFSKRFGEDIAALNSRELVDRYLPKCGIDGLKQALKTARTSDIKLSPEERACLGYSYYSPFFCDAIEMRKAIPGSTIFACVEDQLQREQQYHRYLLEMLSKLGSNDEDKEDEITELLEQQHHFLFIDPLDRCLVDIRLGDVVYANVYVQRFIGDNLNNSLPDFIRLHKGCLYTIEFIDDINELEIAQDFLKRLNAIKKALIDLEKACHTNPMLQWQPLVRKQHKMLSTEISKYYYLSYRE